MKKHKHTDKLSILTLLLASNALFSCTNSVYVLGGCGQGEQINQSFKSNKYQAVKIGGPITEYNQRREKEKENEVKFQRLKEIAKKYNNEYLRALMEKDLIDRSLLTEEKLEEIEETSKYRAISRESEEILDLCIGIAKDKKYARKLIKEEGLDLTPLSKDVLIQIKEEMDDPANAQYRTKWWQSRPLIITSLCLVGGGIILYYKLFYSSSNTNIDIDTDINTDNKPYCSCFEDQDGRAVIQNAPRSRALKMLKDIKKLVCFEQSSKHPLDRDEYSNWFASIRHGHGETQSCFSPRTSQSIIN